MNVSQLPRNMQTKIHVAESGCWEWTGALNSRGYGQVGVLGVSKSTHRVAYELLVAPIPEELQIDHLCRNKPCCNPTHLEPVTPLTNAQRRPDVDKSHCINGHEMTAANTIIKPRTSGSGKIRNCRTCAAESQRRARAKNPGATPRQPLTGPDDQRHGTLNGYSNYKCRCTECQRAYREYMAEYRRKRAS